MQVPSGLPFPIERTTTGNSAVEHHDIERMTLGELKTLVTRWNLRPTDGGRNKASYIQALKTFSEDRTSWTMKPIMTRKHKGPRKSPRKVTNPSAKSSPKRSTLRREHLMASAKYKSTERSKDMRTVNAVAILNGFVERILATESCIHPAPMSFPDSLPDTTAQPHMEPSSPQATPSLSIGTLSPVLRSSTDNDQAVHADTQASLPLVVSHLISTTNSLTTTVRALQEQIPHIIPAQHSASHQNLETPKKHFSTSIQLASGELFFNTAEIPPPPACKLDLVQLDNMWDDSPDSPQWDRKSSLNIHNTPIAIVHWPTVYQYRGNKYWAGLKQRWYNWKALITEYRSLGPDSFANKYLKDGQPYTLSGILRIMTEARVEEDKEIVIRARREYGNTFDIAFSHTNSKSNGNRVLTMPYAIARRYRRLHGTTPNIPRGADYDEST